MVETMTRKRRTSEEQIADLESKIAVIKARSERRRARQNPAVRQVLFAVRALDKALANSKDQVLRRAAEDARTTLGACLAVSGVAPKQLAVPRARSRSSRKEQP